MGFEQADRRRSGDSGRIGPVQSPVRPPGTRPPCVAAGTSGQPQRKMQDKQRRDAASVPVMLEVAVHRDGGLWRPVLWEGRRGLTEMQAAETSRNGILSVFSEGSTPPRYSSCNPAAASVFVSPDRLRCPDFPTSSPHRRAAVTCRLSTTLPPLRLRKRVGEPGQGWVSGFHLEIPVTFPQVGTRPTPACDSVTWGQDHSNSCSVVIAGPWQDGLPILPGTRKTFAGLYRKWGSRCLKN